MKKLIQFVAIIFGAMLFVILVNAVSINAQEIFQQGPHLKLMKQLTEEQQEEVKAKMKELWESGASRSEIRDTVKHMFEEYGVEMPQRGEGVRRGRGHRSGRGFMKYADQLNEEQKNAIKEKVKSLHEEGLSRNEIHVEVRALFKEYGIEIPDDFDGYRGKRGRRPGRGWMHFEDELTDEQRAAIRKKVESMRDEGASREETHTEVETMLKGYGIELPEDIKQHRKMMENLTEDQRKKIRAKVRKMRKEGATKEEIRKEMQNMFKEYEASDQESQGNQDIETSGKSLIIRAYPNPFNPETNIEYQLKSSSQVSITIYNIQGKQVRSLADTYRQTGTYNIKWDSLNDNGTQVPSGVYFIRITAGNETLNHRIVMMK